jgi:hypothetical protein
MLTLLTATGARPEAWALCCLWMQRQDYVGRVKWIIVDDGKKPSIPPDIPGWDIRIYRRRPYWRKGWNTQALNIRLGASKADPTDWLVIIEDDDHYKTGWLTRVEQELQEHELVGQLLCRKYNIGTCRGRALKDYRKASLCCTAMRGGALQAFRKIARRGPRLMDCDLWSGYTGHLFDGDYVTSIKRMPGRGGIDSGHRREFGNLVDSDGSLLRAWIGDDADHYREFMNRDAIR